MHHRACSRETWRHRPTPDVVLSEPVLAEDGLELVGTAVWVTVPVLVHLHVERLRAREAQSRPRAVPHLSVGPASVVDLREAPSEDADIPASGRASR